MGRARASPRSFWLGVSGRVLRLPVPLHNASRAVPTLSDRTELRAFLKRHGLCANKALGQHFLCSRTVVEAIVGRLEGCRSALEVGPGPGVLTGPISEAVGTMKALELDSRMASALSESAPRCEVVLGDVLEADLAGLIESMPPPRAVVSNMPYNITGPLLTRIAGARRSFDRAVLMMQKEVADRVRAEPGDSDRGSLSVFLQAQFSIMKVADVPAGAFEPPPKVDSTVLELVPREFGLNQEDEARFFRFVRGCFRMPRKTLANNLAALVGKESSASAIEAAGMEPRTRPHLVTLDGWLELWRRSVPGGHDRT